MCCRSRLSTFSVVMFALHMLSKHCLLSSSINSAHLLRPARRLLKTIVRNVRHQIAVYGLEANSYFLSLKNMIRILDVLSLNQTRISWPEGYIPSSHGSNQVRMKALGWTSGRKEKTFCSTQPLQQCCRAEFFSLITYTKVTTCILLIKPYIRSSQNKAVQMTGVFS